MACFNICLNIVDALNTTYILLIEVDWKLLELTKIRLHDGGIKWESLVEKRYLLD